MRKLGNKKFSLLMAIVFMFTVIFPAGSAFADEADFSSAYNYISADKNQAAGTITVKPDDSSGTICSAVYFTVTLPEGVEFASTPKANDIASFITGTNVTINADSFVSSGIRYVKVWVSGATWDTNSPVPSVKFDFGQTKSKLDIDSDFKGNLNATVEVEGVTGNAIQWAISDDLTIAKVAEGKITIKAGILKKVSAGGNKTVAKIMVIESKAGEIPDNARVYLEIKTKDVEFSKLPTVTGKDGIQLKDFDSSTETEYTKWDNNDHTKVYADVDKKSATFPSTIEFLPINLNISPGVDGDIEITATVYEMKDGQIDEDLEEETLTVATIGDVGIKVEDLKDNDDIVYSGQNGQSLDVEFTVATTDGTYWGTDDNKGDIISFTLNKGEFATTPKVNGKTDNVKLYNDEESFYYTCKTDDKDDLDISDIQVTLDNEDEPGDLTLAIGSDFGKMDAITIAKVAKPFTVKADRPAISSEALGQAAGDLTITEADGGAIEQKEYIYVELPSGVELTGKPKVETTEGNGDAEIDGYNHDYFVIKFTKDSGSKPSTYRVYDIKYDTGKLALTGDVELKFYGDEEDPKASDKYDFEDDSLMTTVVNATVTDVNAVAADFKIGDEGVAVVNGRTLVQVNLLTDTLGLQKRWDETTKTAYFVQNGKVVSFPMNENAVYINGTKIAVDQGGKVINNYTYASLRGIQMAFGGELAWDDATKIASFNFTK